MIQEVEQQLQQFFGCLSQTKMSFSKPFQSPDAGFDDKKCSPDDATGHDDDKFFKRSFFKDEDTNSSKKKFLFCHINFCLIIRLSDECSRFHQLAASTINWPSSHLQSFQMQQKNLGHCSNPDKRLCPFVTIRKHVLNKLVF